MILTVKTCAWPREFVMICAFMRVGGLVVLLGVLAGRGAVLEPPVFNRGAGVVATGFAFRLTNANPAGAVMFTLDSVDPRNADGTVYTNARAAWDAVTVNRTTTVKARVLSGVDWSPLVETTFITSNDFSKLLITELMYQPPGTNGTHERSREFAELKNTGNEILDISGVSFQGFSFPTQTLIHPGEFKVLIQNTNAYLLDHPGAVISGRYFFRLPNDGAIIDLYHASGAVLFSMSYKTHGPWPSVPDDHNFTDKGFSLVPTDPNANAEPHHYRSWRPSSFEGGSPGMDDPPDRRPRIKLTEVLARPDSTGYPREAMELYNPHATNVNIGGWFLSDSRPRPKGYHIPPNTIVPARGFLVLDSGQFGGPNPTNRIALSSEGEGAYLFSATTNRNLTGYGHGFDFVGSDRGMTYGLVTNSIGDEYFFPLASETIGTANSRPAAGPIAITELNYFATSNTALFAELMNITDDWVALFDLQNPHNTWHLGIGAYYVFPPDILIPPRSLFLVVGEDPETFRTRHGVPDEVPIFGPVQYFPDALRFGVHLIRLSGLITDTLGVRPRMIPVDSIEFQREFPWPAAANGSGSSLQRLAPHEFANDPKNWRASVPSPGRPNFARPIDGWRTWQFNASELTDPAISGDDADPDHDGLNNVAEYAFGLDPHVPGVVPMRVEVVEGRLTVTVRKYDGAPDAEIFGESASDLSGPWSSQDVESELFWPETTLRERAQGSGTRFLRIRVALQE